MASYTKRQTKKKGVVWDVRFRAIVDGEEKQIKLSGFQTKHDAVRAFNTWEKPQPTSSPMAFENAVRAYLTAHEGVLAAGTLSSFESRVKRHVMPDFKGKRIDLITKSDVKAWALRLWQTTLRQSTCVQTFAAFSKLMSWAAENYHFDNPFDGVKTPSKREHKREMVIWSTDEFRRFLNALDGNEYRLFFEVMFYGGLREGEANALTKSDFMFDGKRYTVKINKSLTYQSQKGLVVTPPKNTFSNRTVSLPISLNSEIDEFFLTHDELCGKMPTLFRHVFDTAIDAASLPRIRIHDLRHSHASILLSEGVPITAVSKRLGHANSQTTLRVYAHAVENTDVVTNFLDKM